MFEKFNKQLSQLCTRSSCTRAFCRVVQDPTKRNNISYILSKYGDTFLCENIHKLRNITHTKGNILDLVFDLLRPCSKTKLQFGNQKWTDKNISVHKYCYFYNKKKLSDEDTYIISGMVLLLSKQFDTTPKYYLGLVILRLFSLVVRDMCDDVQTCFSIHKILCLVHQSGNINKDEYNMGVDIKDKEVVDIKDLNSITNSTNILDLTTNSINNTIGSITFSSVTNSIALQTTIQPISIPSCDSCLICTIFLNSDLYFLINKHMKVLNNIDTFNIRESRRLESILNILYLLYLINEKYNVVPYKKFYIQKTSKLNIKEEFKFYRTKSKTILQYLFILPLHLKAEFIKYENSDLMKASLQDAFFRSLFEGQVDPYLFITVNREDIYKESIRLLQNINQQDTHKQLRITFKNEEGIDSGGIRKEYFQLLSQHIRHDTEVFYMYKGLIYLKESCTNLKKCYCIGKLLGVALYNNIVLNIPLPSFFFKKLLSKRTSFEDLKVIDSELYTTLCNMRRLSAEEIDSLEMTFTVSYTKDKEVYTVNLDNNWKDGTSDRKAVLDNKMENTRDSIRDLLHITGNNSRENNINMNNRYITENNISNVLNSRKVTKENLEIFINNYADYILNESVKTQFNAISTGFYSILQKNILTYIDPKELEKILMGSSDFDFKEIKLNTTYNGYSHDDKVVKYFWEIFEGYNRKMRKKLLQFITGNDRIPVSGPSSLRLVIMKNGCDTDRLPSTQTCFNTLLLPEYNSKEKMYNKLGTALEMTAGFFLL